MKRIFQWISRVTYGSNRFEIVPKCDRHCLSHIWTGHQPHLTTKIASSRNFPYHRITIYQWYIAETIYQWYIAETSVVDIPSVPAIDGLISLECWNHLPQLSGLLDTINPAGSMMLRRIKYTAGCSAQRYVHICLKCKSNHDREYVPCLQTTISWCLITRLRASSLCTMSAHDHIMMPNHAIGGSSFFFFFFFFFFSLFFFLFLFFFFFCKWSYLVLWAVLENVSSSCQSVILYPWWIYRQEHISIHCSR